MALPTGLPLNGLWWFEQAKKPATVGFRKVKPDAILTIDDHTETGPIEALVPHGQGHQFALYGDSCSGVPGHLHEANLAKVNDVVLRLTPEPEFVVYPGDEVIGLTGCEDELRAQWAHWWNKEMVALVERDVPIFNCTGNHTVYDRMSERVFGEVCSHLPISGPDEASLSYFMRRDDLLLIFVNTLNSDLGGEGHVETTWLEQVLEDNRDARWIFVIGHHPVFPVNGYVGAYQRTIGPEYRDRFWRLLADNNVFAYLCSHILAFDVQVHRGVLQITTAGAGTAHRMPPDVEYLHCVQAAIDQNGLRYQVLDDNGRLRERLQWPPRIPSSDSWNVLSGGEAWTHGALHAFRFCGSLPAATEPRRQTLLSLQADSGRLSPLWIGFAGPDHRLSVSLQPQHGRSPHNWLGPSLRPGSPFDIQIALHPDMGPGGMLWRDNDQGPWSSLEGASPWGPERLDCQGFWVVGSAAGGNDMPFSGSDLSIRHFASQDACQDGWTQDAKSAN